MQNLLTEAVNSFQFMLEKHKKSSLCDGVYVITSMYTYMYLATYLVIPMCCHIHISEIQAMFFYVTVSACVIFIYPDVYHLSCNSHWLPYVYTSSLHGLQLFTATLHLSSSNDNPAVRNSFPTTEQYSL